MKTKLLPTMIGAALAAGMGVAQADITVFGHLDTSIVSTDRDEGWRNIHLNPSMISTSGLDYSGWYTDSVGDHDDLNFVCTTCSIGFKGSEDLGNGLKAIFSLDFQFDMFSRDSTSLTDRDQWLGLAGNFGSVKFGTVSTSYKSHGAMIDPLYRTAAQGRGLGLQSYLHNEANEDGGGRHEYMARWDSPNWNGLKVTAHYSLDSNENDGANFDNISNAKLEEDDDAYGAGVQYSNGGILVFADYVTNNGDDNDNRFGDMSAWKLGGKYTINNFAVMGQYEDIEQGFWDNDLSGKQEGTWWHLAGTYTMGNNMVYLGYGQSEFTDIDNGDSGAMGGDIESDAFTLAGTHSLSKRTTVYAAYSMQSQDADDGVNHSVNCDYETGASCKEVDKDVFALGMKHKF